MLKPPWYRNQGRRHLYHHPSSDWVRTGLALCGINIGKAAYVANHEEVFVRGYRVCRKCLKKLEVSGG
jgi:hypothetical protein